MKTNGIDSSSTERRIIYLGSKVRFTRRVCPGFCACASKGK